jgi:beta-lactamase superfamily II metal-dependent hydrolase
MLNLRAIQAEHGDCFLLEYGTPASARYVLIDGGPANVYQDHLQHVLKRIKEAGGSLERVILSHVDDDHINGLLDLMADVKRSRDRGAPEIIAIQALWHNTFSNTLGPEVEDQFRDILEDAGETRDLMPSTDMESRNIDQGDQLTQAADELCIGINRDFDPETVITVDWAPPAIVSDNLTLRVVGPTKKNLDDLQQEWINWLQKQKDLLSSKDLLDEVAIREADESVPNLSSIMILAEADGKTILLTGDGRGDDLLEGLGQAKLLGPDGTCHVDVLKLPHHGSQRNVSPEFFRKLTADRYVISANGKYGNPDLPTLKWLVQAAKDQGRTIEIWITNQTECIQELIQACHPDEYGYRLVELEPGNDQMILTLAA